MSSFTRSFQRIVPSLRASTLELIENNPLSGQRLMVPVRDGEVSVFVNRAARKGAPCIFEFHGGGFVLGDARKDDHLREVIKDALDATVIGVNYRLAPEYPYPTAIHDAYDVILYFYEHAQEFDLDVDKFITLGFSAGSNLAAVVAILAGEKEEFKLAGQVLHYPYLDAVTPPEVKKQHPADLPMEVMVAFNELYTKEDPRDATISPLYATREQLEKMPETALFMAKEDALCDEGIQFGKKLNEAGVKVKSHAVPGAYHGYMEDLFNQSCYDALPDDTRALHHPDIEKIAYDSMEQTIAWIRALLNREIGMV